MQIAYFVKSKSNTRNFLIVVIISWGRNLICNRSLQVQELAIYVSILVCLLNLNPINMLCLRDVKLVEIEYSN